MTTDLNELIDAAHDAGIALKASALGLLAHGQKGLAMELNEKADRVMAAAEKMALAAQPTGKEGD